MLSGLLISYMMRRAQKRHGQRIAPAGEVSAWRDAITECDITNTITLWYNVQGDQSTHTIILTRGVRG